jgi:hypothetical protein
LRSGTGGSSSIYSGDKEKSEENERAKDGEKVEERAEHRV